METDELKMGPLPKPAGRLVIKFLQENKKGATMTEILRHLRVNHGKNSEEMNRVVECLLENGAALGFLERTGSHYSNWDARENCCLKRRKHRSRRRKRCRRKSKGRRSRRRRRRRGGSCCCKHRRWPLDRTAVAVVAAAADASAADHLNDVTQTETINQAFVIFGFAIF